MTPDRLEVLIIGGGIGGLAAAHCLSKVGHDVTVLERCASKVSNNEALSHDVGAGAGIQLNPNATRLLFRWGLGEELGRLGVKPTCLEFRHYSDGHLVHRVEMDPEVVQSKFGVPYIQIQRGHLHSLLLGLANKSGVKVHMESPVIGLDRTASGRPVAVLDDGTCIIGDLVIGADGIGSVVRKTVDSNPSSPTARDSAYRATIPTAHLEADPLLRDLVSETKTAVWLGPGRHIVGYQINSGKVYNLVMIHPFKSDQIAQAASEEIKTEYQGWEPRVQMLISHVLSSAVWTLSDYPPLAQWISDEGNIALLGDAAHPLMPYKAQGAGMAIEDAAVLGGLLGHSTRAHMTTLLKAYQSIRQPRVEMFRKGTQATRNAFHSGVDIKAADGDSFVFRKGIEEEWGYDAELAASEWVESSRLAGVHL